MSQGPPIRIFFVDFWHPPTEERIRTNPLFKLLEKHFNLVLTPEKPDFVIHSCFGLSFVNYDGIRIFYTGENVRPNLAYTDYAFSFDLEESDRSFRLPLYRLYAEYDELFRPRDPDRVMAEERRFCSFLYSNRTARSRVTFFDKLSKYKPIDSGGKVRNTLGYFVQDKMAFLRSCKFSIAFENGSYPGYTTEKLLHALTADTVPIYWGSPEVHLDFNREAFVNCHDYRSFDEVVEVVREIDRNDDLYRKYLSAPYLPGGQETSWCREEVIVDRFRRIFEERKPQISPSLKARHARLDRHLLKAQSVLQKARRAAKRWTTTYG